MSESVWAAGAQQRKEAVEQMVSEAIDGFPEGDALLSVVDAMNTAMDAAMAEHGVHSSGLNKFYVVCGLLSMGEAAEWLESNMHKDGLPVMLVRRLVLQLLETQRKAAESWVVKIHPGLRERLEKQLGRAAASLDD